MDNTEFQSWMRRMADEKPNTPPPSANAVWWKARLRGSLVAEDRAIRPMRIAEAAASAVCWVVAGWFAANAGVGVLALFLAFTVVIAGVVRVTLFEKV